MPSEKEMSSLVTKGNDNCKSISKTKLKCEYCPSESRDCTGWYFVYCNNDTKNYTFCTKSCFKSFAGNSICDYEVNNCSICTKKIGNNVESIFCDLCSQWVHRKCIKNLSSKDYSTLCSNNDNWYCPPCQSNIFPFYTLEDDEFIFCCNNYYYNMSSDVKNTCRRLLSLKFNIFHEKHDTSGSESVSTTLDDIDSNNHLDFIDNCDFILDPKENIFSSLGGSELSLIHINIRSIRQNFESLQYFLSQFESKFDVIALTETWLDSKTNQEDYNIEGYKPPHCQNRTGRIGGGVMFYVSENIPSRIIKK